MFTIVLTGAAWWIGKHSPPPWVSSEPSTVDSFQVHGSSMVPTLLGNHKSVQCRSCELVWKVDPTLQPGQLSTVPCSHCGNPLAAGDAPPKAATLPGADVVQVGSNAELKPGDLVAVQEEDRIQVKRLAALPGDQVDVDDLQLMVNGERLEDQWVGSGLTFPLPKFVIDIDARRSVSRWVPDDSSRCWTRPDKGQWLLDGSCDSTWLVYHHQSAHDHNRSSPVWDDYPFNVGLKRKLHQVDRFSLQGRAKSDSATTLVIAFWSRGGNVVERVPIRGDQEFSVSYYGAGSAENLPVTAERPVAIRAETGPLTLVDLKIERWIEYRLRPSDDRSVYPLRVEQGTCFVVGDNVPVSVDSRDIGPIPITKILGVVSTP